MIPEICGPVRPSFVKRCVAALLSLVGVLAGMIAVFTIAETITRAWWPEFVTGRNDEVTSRGKRRIYGEIRGVPARLPSQGWEPEGGLRRLVFVGDSITEGHGLAFEDTYYGVLGRLVHAAAPQAGLVLETAAVQGSNYQDNLDRIRRLEIGPGDVVYYQFNFNDIVPVDRETLRKDRNSLAARFHRFRVEVLDRSAFLRVAQHLGGWLKTRTSGTCEERGVDALGPYTWTFGARPFRAEAERLWADFSSRLRRAAEHVRSRGGDLRLLLVPILYHVDREGFHVRYNYLNRDFSCATIDPHERLSAIAEELGLGVIDAEPTLRRGFLRRIEEGNPENFYFPADDNHINAIGSQYVAEALLADLMSRAGLVESTTAGCDGRPEVRR